MGARPSGWSCGNYSFRSRRGQTRIERVDRSIAGRISGWAVAVRIKICHSISAIAGLFLAFAPFAAPCAMAEPADLDLVCSGNSYGKDGDPFPTTETVSFKREGKKPVMIGLPGSDKPTTASIISSIQLKFSARGLTREYFN